MRRKYRKRKQRILKHRHNVNDRTARNKLVLYALYNTTEEEIKRNRQSAYSLNVT